MIPNAVCRYFSDYSMSRFSRSISVSYTVSHFGRTRPELVDSDPRTTERKGPLSSTLLNLDVLGT
jgi:hypothetical protein